MIYPNQRENSMYRIYYPVTMDAVENLPETVAIEGEAHHYLSRVIRLSPGQRVILFDDSLVEWTGEIESIERWRSQVRLIESHPNRCEPTQQVWLMHALPKGSKFFEIIRSVSALGISRVLPFIGQRSVAGIGGKGDSWLQRCEKIALEATRQCGRAKAPRIDKCHLSFEEALKPLVEIESPLGFCLDSGTERPLGVIAQESFMNILPETVVIIVVGPEGGLTGSEIDLAREAGFEICHLGPRILRTELAAVVALSLVQQFLGQLE